MCGITGYLSTKELCRSRFAYANEALSHRGPDHSRVSRLRSQLCAFLGHSRLSIIAPTVAANQPMKCNSGRYTLVFNGEIYNYSLLRNSLISQGITFSTMSDTEVVLKGLIYRGKNFIRELNGMFAFCLHDNCNDTFLLARDRFGIKPLFFRAHAHEFTFSSELKFFNCLSEQKLDLNCNTVRDFSYFGSFQQPNTAFKNIMSLEPGHYIEIKENLSIQKTQYYSLIRTFHKNHKMPYHAAVKRLRNIFNEAVERHMVADVEIGAFLSGGIDSTALVAQMQKISTSPINTFSVGFNDHLGVDNESLIAEETAKYLGTNHTNIIVNDEYIHNIFDDYVEAIDQPSIDGINTYIVSREAAKCVKVAITGVGSDEIFGGYQHFVDASLALRSSSMVNKFVSKMPISIQRKLPISLVGASNYLRNIRIVKQMRLYNELRDKSLNDWEYRDTLSVVKNYTFLELDKYLLNTLLYDSDIMSMAHSLELRPVYLDHELVEFAFSLPDEYKLLNKNPKNILIDSVSDILPKHVINRKKTGFVMPYKHWMDEVLNERFLNSVQYYKKYNQDSSFNIDYLGQRLRTKKTHASDWNLVIYVEWWRKINNGASN